MKEEGKNQKEEVKITPEEIKGVLDFLAEVNVLKRTPRTGWRFAGPSANMEPDEVAAHVAGTAQIAYILARMEGLTIERALKCVALAVFHDNPETRLPETDKIATIYQKTSRAAIQKVMADQTARLPNEVAEEIMALTGEVNFGETLEAQIVRDADTFEASLQAKIFDERGFYIEEEVLKIYLNEERFQTESAKRLVRALRRTKDISIRWWESLQPKIE